MTRYVGNSPANYIDSNGLASAGYHHVYPRFLGGTETQPLFQLGHDEHNAIHRYFIDNEFNATDAGRERWEKLTRAKQREHIRKSMEKAGIPKELIDENIGKIMKGAVPGQNNSKVKRKRPGSGDFSNQDIAKAKTAAEETTESTIKKGTKKARGKVLRRLPCGIGLVITLWTLEEALAEDGLAMTMANNAPVLGDLITIHELIAAAKEEVENAAMGFFDRIYSKVDKAHAQNIATTWLLAKNNTIADFKEIANDIRVPRDHFVDEMAVATAVRGYQFRLQGIFLANKQNMLARMQNAKADFAQSLRDAVRRVGVCTTTSARWLAMARRSTTTSAGWLAKMIPLENYQCGEGIEFLIGLRIMLEGN